MAKQINFYALEKDHCSIRGMAQEAGLVALPRVVPTTEIELAAPATFSPLTFQLEPGEKYFYLIPQSVAVCEVFYQVMKSQPAKSWLMANVSPVIELSPSYRQGERVHHGRLYIDAPQHDPWSGDVYRAYETLARRIRRWQKVSRSLYIGPLTMQLANNGLIKLPKRRTKKSFPHPRPLKKAAMAAQLAG